MGEDFLTLHKRIVDKEKKENLKARHRQWRKDNASNVVVVLNLGAGVQSTSLLLMDSMVYRAGRRAEVESWIEREYEFPQIDFAVFADTQDEPKDVYNHLEKLKSHNVAPIISSTQGRLGDDLIAGRKNSGQSFASIPAFTSSVEGQEGGVVRRQCTKEYKVDVVEKAIRRQIFGLKPGQTIPRDSKVVQIFGLSFDEPNRVVRVKSRIESLSWSEPLFPIYDLEMDRSDCKAFLESIGWTVPRSACVFCPYKSNQEWRHLKENDPEGWARAVEVDRALRDPKSVCNRNMISKLYIHRSCLPLELAPIDKNLPILGFLSECEGMCGS